jgi:hypothetical protein
MNRRQQRKQRALGVLEYWNDGMMVNRRTRPALSVIFPPFHFSSVPFFHSPFSQFSPVELNFSSLVHRHSTPLSLVRPLYAQHWNFE